MYFRTVVHKCNIFIKKIFRIVKCYSIHKLHWAQAGDGVPAGGAASYI